LAAQNRPTQRTCCTEKNFSLLLTEENVAVHKFGTQNVAAHKIWLPKKLVGQKKFAVQIFGNSN
jgi:hypothetical protein